MALITDPDQLNQATEITIDTVALDFTLNIAGNLSNDGVTGQALYSFFKEEWKDDANLIKFTFPMLAITPEQFEFGNNGSKFSDWKPANDNTRDLVRTAGWREYDNAGTNLREYAGIISLGSLGASDQPYYEQTAGTPVDFAFQGVVNEAVQVFGDANNGNFDHRSSFNIFAREEQKTFAQSSIGDIGVTTMTYQVYRFPLSNGTDLKVQTNDIGIDANSDGTPDVSPYDSMSITYLDGQGFTAWANSTVYSANDVVQSGSDGRWYITAAGGTSNGNDSDLAGGSDTGVTWTAFTGERQIGSSWFPFSIIIAGNAAVAEDIYTFVQFELRQDSDIDAGAGTVNGKTADALNEFIGDTLRTLRTGDGLGTYIDNFDSNDTNRLEFTDSLGVVRTFPFVAAGKIQFNPNIVNHTAAKYWMFFKRTQRLSGADLDISGASGTAATLGSSGTDLSVIANGDYVLIGGFTNTENNGLWQATGAGTATSVALNKLFGVNPVNEAAGNSVTVDLDPLESADAVIVDDNGGSDITGLVTGAQEVNFDFDYDGNVQGGRTAGQDAEVTVRVVGLTTAQYVEAEFTISRATGLNFPRTAALERNYQNAA